MPETVFRFNGVDLSDVLDVNPTRKLGHTAEDYTQVVPGADGERFVRRRLKPLVIPLKVRLKLEDMPPEDVALARRRVIAALVTDEPKRLVIPDEPTRYYKAILTDPGELDTLWRNGGATIEFTAYDPVAFGEHRERMATEGVTAVMVRGSGRTRPRLALTATGGKVRATHQESGLYVVTLDEVDAGSEVVMDMQEEDTLVDGEPVPIELGSDYFALGTGVQKVELSGASGVIEWDERWV